MISVIIPAFNAEKTLRRSVNSVQNQTYKDIEIVIVNDGSTDETEKICCELAKCDKRISVYSKINGGLSSARNFGMRKSKGDFIAFLDSDDEYDTNFLNLMYSTLIEENVDMVVCGYYSIYIETNKIKASETFFKTTKLDKVSTIKELIYSKRLSSHAWNKLYKKEILRDIFYPEGKNYEDMFVMPDIIDKCKSIAFVPYNLVYYYQNVGSITHVSSIKNECDAFEAAYKRYKKYINQFNSLESYLIKEPLEIAIRLVFMDKENNSQKLYFDEIKEEIIKFISYARNNHNSYKRIRLKYKILLFYTFLKKEGYDK